MSIKFIKGQSLFELVIAIGVTGLVLVAIMSLSVKSLANATYSKNKTLATRHTQEAMEWLRAQRDTGWEIFLATARTSSSFCLSNLNFDSAGSCSESQVIPGTIFVRQVDFVCSPGGVTPEKVEASVITSWTSSLDRTHESRATTVFTNWMVD